MKERKIKQCESYTVKAIPTSFVLKYRIFFYIHVSVMTCVELSLMSEHQSKAQQIFVHRWIIMSFPTLLHLYVRVKSLLDIFIGLCHMLWTQRRNRKGGE